MIKFRFTICLALSILSSPAVVYAAEATPSAAVQQEDQSVDQSVDPVQDVNPYDSEAPSSWVPDDGEVIGGSGAGKLDDPSDFSTGSVPVEYIDYIERHSDELEAFSDPSVFDTYHRNIVVYTGTFGDTQYDLIVPFSAYSVLDVYDGLLLNVGPDTVVGRLEPVGGVIDPSEYDYMTYTLSPVYGSSQNVYEYGSLNYMTHYYKDSRYDRITSSRTYGAFEVEDTVLHYGAADRTYYILICILAALIGGTWICRQPH